MARNLVETVLGAAVLLVAAAFVLFAVQRAEVGQEDGYSLTASFLRVGDLQVGSDVRISGVKVGSVIDRTLDTDNFEAVILMAIDSGIALPADTEAVVTSEGLLGGKYLRLIPGSAEEILAPGEALRRTRDFRSLEDSVSEIIFLATSKGDADR